MVRERLNIYLLLHYSQKMNLRQESELFFILLIICTGTQVLRR
nr:MAG TPA: hypothetical protein [Crassvirales sp.]